jgi:hypothetical protein
MMTHPLPLPTSARPLPEATKEKLYRKLMEGQEQRAQIHPLYIPRLRARVPQAAYKAAYICVAADDLLPQC